MLADRTCIVSGGNVLPPALSAQQYVSCANNGGCNGGVESVTWDYAYSTGLVSRNSYKNIDSILNSLQKLVYLILLILVL